MTDLRGLAARLSVLEVEIQQWIAEHSDGQPASHDSIAALMAVKSAVDRIRPLLWIQLRRLGVQGVADEEETTPPPSDVAAIMATAGLTPDEVPKRFIRQRK